MRVVPKRSKLYLGVLTRFPLLQEANCWGKTGSDSAIGKGKEKTLCLSGCAEPAWQFSLLPSQQSLLPIVLPPSCGARHNLRSLYMGCAASTIY